MVSIDGLQLSFEYLPNRLRVDGSSHRAVGFLLSVILFLPEGGSDPEYGVAPGQAAVFYNKDRVLGGGWIESTGEVEQDWLAGAEV